MRRMGQWYDDDDQDDLLVHHDVPSKWLPNGQHDDGVVSADAQT